MMPFQAMRLRKPSSGSAWVTAFTWTPLGNVTGWNGYTVRQGFGPTILTPGSKIRLTVRAMNAGTPVAIGAMYAGIRAATGDAYDFAATPMQVTFGGSSTLTMTGEQSVVSDEIALPLAAGQGLVVAAYFNGTTTIPVGSDPGATNHYKLGADASTVNAAGYTGSSNTLGLISRVEVFTP